MILNKLHLIMCLCVRAGLCDVFKLFRYKQWYKYCNCFLVVIFPAEDGEQLEIQMNPCVCCLWQELSIGGK